MQKHISNNTSLNKKDQTRSITTIIKTEIIIYWLKCKRYLCRQKKQT